MPGQAKDGVHSHTAPFLPGLNPSNGLRGSPTPRFNWPDGVWNNGEAFAGPDTGGGFGFDDGTSLQKSDIQTMSGWAVKLNPLGEQVYRFVGYLRPAPLPQPEVVDNGAFEVFAPLAFDPDADTVIVLVFSPTVTPPGAANGGTEAYPGQFRPDGLFLAATGSDPARPAPNPSLFPPRSQDAGGCNIIACYGVPTVGSRDLVHTLQRGMQLERAVQLMLKDSGSLRPPSVLQPLDEDVPVVTSGTSAGGLSSQLLPMLFPGRFHGAVSYSFSGYLRRVMGDQETYAFVAALCGFGRAGRAYSRFDCLQWATWLRQLPGANDYFDVSFVPLFDAGQIRRPQYFLMADEDNVTNGTEWATLFDGVRAYRNAGRQANSNPAADVYWSRLDKACHDAYRFVIPGALTTSGQDTTEEHLWRAVVPFVQKAIASATAVPNPPPPTFQNMGPPTDADAYDHALGRPATSARLAARPVVPPGVVSLDATWSAAHRACGTWLGDDDSMVVAGGHVYVGGADGVVSKLAVGGNNAFVIVDQTESLGFQVGAMAISGTTLVVGTYGHLHTIDVSQSPMVVTGTAVLPWEHHRPGRMRVAKLFGSTDYVVFRSVHGELAVWTLGLVPVSDFTEPAIVDFAFGDTPRVAGKSLPIYLLSERGRVVKIVFSDPINWTPAVTGVSDYFVGQPRDLVKFPSGGGSAMAAFYRHTAATDTIKLLSTAEHPSASNMALTFAYSDAGNASPAGDYPARAGSLDGVGDLEFLPADGGLPDSFVVLNGSVVSIESLCGTCSYSADLGNTPAIAASGYPTAIEVADVVANVPGGSAFTREAIIATEGGHVLWFKLDDVVSGTINTVYGVDGLPATWGMAVVGGKLHVLDQCARRFEVDPLAAAPGVLKEVLPGWEGNVAIKPFRDLVHVGYVPPAYLAGVNRVAQIAGFPSSTHMQLLSPVLCPVIQEALPAFAFLPPNWTPPPWITLDWQPVLKHDVFANGFMAFGLAGDTMTLGGGDEHTYWWGGYNDEALLYRNNVRGVVWDGLALSDNTIWSSARIGTLPPGSAPWLRSVRSDVMHDLGSVRLGLWSRADFGESTPRIVATTTGGSVQVLDPNVSGAASLIGELDHESPMQNDGDHGFGGIALSVAAVRGDGAPTIFFGTVATHAGKASGTRDMVSSLHIYERLPTAPGLRLVSTVAFDGSPSQPKLFGICGLAVGDLAGDSAPELVITTLNGDLVIYSLVVLGGSNDVALGTLLQWEILDGALGAYNSIVIDDLDGQSGNELYLAGTMGLRRFK